MKITSLLRPAFHRRPGRLGKMTALAAAFFLLAESLQGQVVNFPDPQMAKMINRALFRSPNSTITVSNLAELRFLYVILENFRDPPVNLLEGLQFATNLARIRFEGLRGFIRETQSATPPFTPIDLAADGLAPLSGLANLEQLDFYECKLPNAVLPNGLVSLKRLSIQGCGTTNLVIPDSLTNLVSLRLTGNDLNLSAPGALPSDRSHLTTVELADAPSPDLSWIGSLSCKPRKCAWAA